eukprot:jgi/Chrzof1/10310/Cz04g37010.t1
MMTDINPAGCTHVNFDGDTNRHHGRKMLTMTTAAKVTAEATAAKVTAATGGCYLAGRWYRHCPNWSSSDPCSDRHTAVQSNCW